MNPHLWHAGNETYSDQDRLSVSTETTGAGVIGYVCRIGPGVWMIEGDSPEQTFATAEEGASALCHRVASLPSIGDAGPIE